MISDSYIFSPVMILWHLCVLFATSLSPSDPDDTLEKFEEALSVDPDVVPDPAAVANMDPDMVADPAARFSELGYHPGDPKHHRTINIMIGHQHDASNAQRPADTGPSADLASHDGAATTTEVPVAPTFAPWYFAKLDLTPS